MGRVLFRYLLAGAGPREPDRYSCRSVTRRDVARDATEARNAGIADRAERSAEGLVVKKSTRTDTEALATFVMRGAASMVVVESNVRYMLLSMSRKIEADSCRGKLLEKCADSS